MIFLDSYAVHTCDEVRDALRVRDAGLVVVPPGQTGLCQPLDVSVNRSFKAHMRKLYEEWLAQCNFTYTRAGNVKRPSHDIIVSWVSKAWSAVDVGIIRRCFRLCGLASDVVPLEELHTRLSVLLTIPHNFA